MLTRNELFEDGEQGWALELEKLLKYVKDGWVLEDREESSTLKGREDGWTVDSEG